MAKKRSKVEVHDGYFRCRRCRALIAAELMQIHAANHAKLPIKQSKPKKKRRAQRRDRVRMLRDDESTSVKAVSGGLPGLGRRR